MPSRVAFRVIVVVVVAATATGCQSPWQTASPGHGGGGWFSWLGRSERTHGEDPLARLAGGGEYGPGDAEADQAADRSRKELYADRAGEMNLSREGAQRPASMTLDQAAPVEDDAASRLVRSLQQRRGQPGASPEVAASQSASLPPAFDAAVVPAGHQSALPSMTLSAAPSQVAAPRAYVDTAPPDAQSNPFYDPFGAAARQEVVPADYRQGSSPVGGVRTASNAAASNSASGSALRLLSTPPDQETAASQSAIAYPGGSSATSGGGSLLKLLGDNPLRKDASAAPSAGGDYMP